MILTIKEIQDIETEIVKEVADICKRNNIDYFLHCGSALGAIRHGGPIPWDRDVDIIVPYNQFDIFLKTVRTELSEKFYLDYHDTNKYYPALFPRIGLRGYSTKLLHVDIFKLVGISPNIKEQLQFVKKARFYRNLFLPKTKHSKYYGEIPLLKTIWIYLNKILLLPIPKKMIITKFDRLCNKYPLQEMEFVTNPSGHYGIKNVIPKKYYNKGILVKYSGFDVKIPEQYDLYLQHYYGDYMQLPPEKNRLVKKTYEIVEFEL